MSANVLRREGEVGHYDKGRNTGMMQVQIRNLVKSYGEQRAVDGISFEIRRGEIVGFLGPNGAGKTTTMKIITGYLKPDSGEVRFDGVSSLERDFRHKIGYLPETNPLYTDMPVIDYLKLSARLQDVPESEIPARVRKMIEVCGLGDEKHKTIGELSKGYRQRVGLAQAIIHDPELLILDEPTSGLDPNQIVEIRQLIREIGKTKTVILSTHILPEVEATCDRIIIIHRGKLVADSTAGDLRRQAEGKSLLTVRIEGGTSEEQRSALGQISSVQGVESVMEGGVQKWKLEHEGGDGTAAEVFDLCVQRGWKLLEMVPQQQKLEDVFRALTMEN